MQNVSLGLSPVPPASTCLGQCPKSPCFDAPENLIVLILFILSLMSFLGAKHVALFENQRDIFKSLLSKDLDIRVALLHHKPKQEWNFIPSLSHSFSLLGIQCYFVICS